MEATIHAQHWLRFLTCYFAFRPLCNLCPLIPGRVPPAALRRRKWGLCFLWPTALLRLSNTLCGAAGFVDKSIAHPCSSASGLVDVINFIIVFIFCSIIILCFFLCFFFFWIFFVRLLLNLLLNLLLIRWKRGCLKRKRTHVEGKRTYGKMNESEKENIGK